MLLNYLKITFRNLIKYRGYAFINIAGLAIGMACSFLILLWAIDEVSFDRFHENRNDIYRIITETNTGDNQTASSNSPNALGPALHDQYPEVTTMARYMGGFSGWLIQRGDKSFTNDRWAAVDPSFFQMFSFPFLQGNPLTALNEKLSVVISDKMAQKYFGDENAIGHILKKDDVDLTITGIIHVPENSHLQFDYAFPIENMRQWFYQDLESWQAVRAAAANPVEALRYE
ncbi:ABC transporter permease [candidate division KSB1 bacterium]|nr:ABC transporter permease [candidate division KSB1 bacterium]